MATTPVVKKIGRRVGREFLRVMIVVVQALPLNTGLALGRGFGNFMRVLSGKRYRVALKNLRIAFGDTLTEPERIRIAKQSFQHFGMFAIEVIKFSSMSQEEVEKRLHVDEGSFEEFEKLMLDKKGCLLITGHLGNFEIAGRWIVPRGYEIIGLARESRDRGTTEMMTKLRERSGVKIITLGMSLKPIIAGLRRNAGIAIVCDQNATDVFVPFFGHPTGTVDGPARISLKMGAPMLFFYCVRDGKGGYRIRSHGHYLPVSTGNEVADVETAMTEVNKRLEEIIRLYPEQWLWFHNRWKSSPGVNP